MKTDVERNGKSMKWEGDGAREVAQKRREILICDQNKRFHTEKKTHDGARVNYYPEAYHVFW